MPREFPAAPVPIDQVEPVPRRVRAFLGGRQIVDTTHAQYVWHWPFYPQFYLPLADVRHLVDENRTEMTSRGTAQVFGLRAGSVERREVARVFGPDAIEGLVDTVHLEWTALDAWYEEDERVFVHPRNPYTRVDALRSSRTVRVQLDGVLLAESSSPVLVFETGLPTRYYFDRTCVSFEHLEATGTETACPYKGRTSEYWSVRIGDSVHHDLAWAYDFPTAALLPVAGLVCFYNEKVDITVDGVALERPATHFT